MQQFAYDLNILSKMIGMSDDQVLEHLKEAFSPKIKTQIPQIDDINIAIYNWVLILSHTTGSSMLARMTDRNKTTNCSGQANKISPNNLTKHFARME